MVYNKRTDIRQTEIFRRENPFYCCEGNVVSQSELMGKGLFPETLPPCFVSKDLERCFTDITASLEDKQFHNGRGTSYTRFSGTKHDGSRRSYAAPNPIPYFSICAFLEKNWQKFEDRFKQSPFSVSSPRVGKKTDERAVVVPSLSELSVKASKNIRYSPYMLKTDISQFFPSIYTHSIAWSAHGVEEAKKDTDKKSTNVYFNSLDFFIQNTQRMQTRGVLIGPDAFRLIAEFIACDIDVKLHEKAASLIIGAVRHVDDFYIGVRSEIDALAVLSILRDVLQSYELQINDAKTKILSALAPIDDVWAQQLRYMPIFNGFYSDRAGNIFHLLDKAFELSANLKTESPMKVVLRRMDNEKIYESYNWDAIEPRLQRMLSHFPHCIDYICLIVVKRFAIGKEIDVAGWGDAVHYAMERYQQLNHHHEVIWLLWLLLSCGIPISEGLVASLCKMDNDYVHSMLVAAYVSSKIPAKPQINLGAMDCCGEHWLKMLVTRSVNFTKAPFHGQLKPEFEHLADKGIVLVDFQSHIDSVKKSKIRAISKSRYGYDSDNSDPGSDTSDDNFDEGILF